MDAMHLYKRGPTWWLRFRDHTGHMRRLRASTNRRVAEHISRNVGHLIECASGGASIPEEMIDWIQTLDASRRQRLAGWGLVSEQRIVSGDTLDIQLTRWEKGLIARGRSSSYAETRKGRAERLFDSCRFKLYRDIDAEAVLAKLDEWRRDGKLPGDWHRRTEVSENTLSHYLSAAKGFTRWMHRHRYASHDALAVLSVERRSPRAGTKRSTAAQRRAMTDSEQMELVSKTSASDKILYGVAPKDRSILYHFTLGTGLRQGAIRRLTVGDVCIAERVVFARGSGSRNKTSSPKPLSESLARALSQHIQGRSGDEPLFHMPRKYDMAKMLRQDCEDAGIPVEGIDFHALRHTFGTSLARRGIHPKTLMTLMDHASIQMTMKLYTHSFPEDQALAVEQLPDLAPPPSEDQRQVG